MIELVAMSASKSEPPSTHPEHHRILIVEDSEDVRELLVECLQSLGHEVFSAADGSGGAERFAAVQPDIALVDVGLPDIDGYELARRIRAGQVYVNGFGAGGGIELPFGGVKRSGHGREKGLEALREFSVVKTIVQKHG